MCSMLDGRGLKVPRKMAAMAPRTLTEILAWPSFTWATRRSAPDVPGLYCIVIDDEHLVYTGVTGVSLRQRWASHHIGFMVDKLGVPRIYYWLMFDDYLLYWLEIAIMQRFHPILNGWSMSRVVIEIAPDGRKSFRRRGWHEPESRS